MRRLAPLGLAILLLLTAGSIWVLGVGSTPRPLCTVGCILDVYPCRDPVTGGPPVPHCPEPAAGAATQSVAATTLTLALAALAALSLLWWWIDRGRPGPGPDAGGPPTVGPPPEPVGSPEPLGPPVA